MERKNELSKDEPNTKIIHWYREMQNDEDALWVQSYFI
jgi:hypothetical protein